MKILTLLSSNKFKTTVPTGIDNITGVKNETPTIPYLRQSLTNRLDRLLNTFLC